MSPRDERHEEERLVDTLSVEDLSPAEDMVRAAVDDVWIFQAEAEQADDVTVSSAEFFGDPARDEAVST